MGRKIKILIAGIGGVGGYYGGMLAKTYTANNDIEICFLARGKHLEKIQTDGLKIVHGEKGFVAHPEIATDNTNDIGIADFILLCTKSYDLEKTILQITPCVGPETMIIPFLNGVDSTEVITRLLPGNLVAGGCVYIVSSIKDFGEVHNTGNMQALYFGLDNVTNDKLILLEKILKNASIEAMLTNNISSVMWEKFHFIAANSTATSYYNDCTGNILADDSKKQFLYSLLNEVNQVSIAKGITFDKDIIASSIKRFHDLPYQTTSSMQRDFQKANGKTELETITGYVCHNGKQFNIPTPYFETAYDKLKSRG